MSAAQRVSRGFHRLAVFLAAIPLIVGGTWAFSIARDEAYSARRSHDEQVELDCAKKRLTAMPNPAQSGDVPRLTNGQPDYNKMFGPAPNPQSTTPAQDAKKPGETDWGSYWRTRDLKELGCSNEPRTVSDRDILDASPPANFSYAVTFLPPLALFLGITLAISLAVYVLVRAIGWVIGGFAAT
jgi:hypothetical protein